MLLWNKYFKVSHWSISHAKNINHMKHFVTDFQKLFKEAWNPPDFVKLKTDALIADSKLVCTYLEGFQTL